jgi:hypothetical protein
VYEGPSPDVDSKDFCMVISNEDDYDVCVPLLEQGKVILLLVFIFILF